MEALRHAGIMSSACPDRWNEMSRGNVEANSCGISNFGVSGEVSLDQLNLCEWMPSQGVHPGCLLVACAAASMAKQNHFQRSPAPRHINDIRTDANSTVILQHGKFLGSWMNVRLWPEPTTKNSKADIMLKPYG